VRLRNNPHCTKLIDSFMTIFETDSGLQITQLLVLEYYPSCLEDVILGRLQITPLQFKKWIFQVRFSAFNPDVKLKEKGLYNKDLQRDCAHA